MTMFKSMAFAGTVAALSSLSFAWSIDGTITSEGSGRALSGVKITSFNYAGIESTSGADGTFTISNEKAGLHSAMVAKAFIGFSNNIITISGIKAQTVTVSVMDALGKVCASQTQHYVNGFMTFDLNKSTAKGAKFLRINVDGKGATYKLGKTVSLMKEGDPLPFLQFSLDGYKNATYQAKAEVETDVQVKMTRGSNEPTSSDSKPESSSAKVEEKSSSSEQTAESSSAKIEQIIVDCAGKTAKSGKDETVKLTVKGSAGQRSFIMHVPSAYKGDKPVPLLIDYHPIGGNSEGQMRDTKYKALTDPEGVISLYPQGTTKTMGPGWNVGPCCSNDDDLEFTREMIKYVREKACIDPQRIYAAGFSMGGGMSNHVACMMSDVFAAVAPAAMDLNKTNSAKCTKARPISVINFRGTGDNVCRYGGGDSGFNDGLNFLGAEGTFKFWADADGCTGSPSKNKDGCDEYSNCKDGVKVVLCTKQGGGHEQGDGKIGWPFLKQFTLPASFVK
jgi:polyhydroxybutyrate depolymerase